jgi:hypothetical protein
MVGESTIKDQNFHVVHEKEVVMTKDNLTKRNWGGSKQCSLCL